jgi:hypothetical protein
MREPRNRVVQVRRFGGPDELEVPSMRSPRLTAVSRRAVSRASSSYARTSRCDATA